MAQLPQTCNIPCIKEKINNINWKVHIYGSIGLYELKINNTNNLPVFFAIPGIDNISMENTMKIIVGSLPVLEKKYHKIFIINYCYSNNMMKESMDKASIGKDDIKSDDIDIMNKDINDFYEKCSLLTHFIISNMGLKNVEVFGKCNGNMIATNLISKSSIYKALYLTSPKNQFKLNYDKCISMKFYFGWLCCDNVMYEKYTYDMTVKQLKVYNYKSKLYEYWEDMLNDICSNS